MAKKALAKLFRNGRSQAVRLPKEFRFEGDHVTIRRVRSGVLLEPVKFDVKEWFAKIDRLRSEPFMKGGRNQPRMPRREVFK
jgi:antitoxin VapB